MSLVSIEFHNSDTFRLVCGPRDTELAKQVPGIRATKADPQSGEILWLFPATWYHANVVRSLFGERLTYADDVVVWGIKQGRAEMERLAVKGRPVREGGPLFDFQKTGVNWLYTQSAILADDMGLGKTVQALVALQLRRQADRGLYDALVVTTNSMKYKWAEEARKWADLWKSVVVVDGSADKRRKLIQNAPPGTLFIVNWESLRTHSRLAGYGSIALNEDERSDKDFNKRAIHYVIADEAHRAKDPHTKQTRALWAVSRQSPYRWALTGTPVNNRQLDLWSLVRFCEPAWMPSRSQFQDRYVFGFEASWGFEPLGWRADTKSELFRFVDLLMLRRSKEEVLKDLPPKLYERREIELTPKQLSAYKAMKKEMMAKIDDELLIATDPLTKLQRLSQIASAVPVIEDGQVVELQAPSNKVNALLEILAETEEPLVVFAASRKLIDLAEKVLTDKGFSNVRITGKESSEMRQLNVEAFQAGSVRVALCTFGAGSEGITLTAASTAVFLQRPWSLVQSRQAEDRLHRIGQVHPVLIIDLVSQGTIDKHVHEILVVKGETLESVVRDKQRLRELMDV